jgi:predicted tellurium resistance membrane protein TerC
MEKYMEWLSDPTALLGFVTLVILEIILGIDNLIFISIVTEKLSPHERNKARFIGLSLALIMRIALLFCISWLATLTSPLFEINAKSFSGRDLILLAGGIFLLFKATIELHERIEGVGQQNLKENKYASFWKVIIQVIILDAVFSIDSIITAIGMVNDISIMISAVIISVIVMMLASNPLTKLVNAHPTLIILCLGFLLMIGFSLIAEGFGFHIPKGYLYSAIGFSLAIEIVNQLVRINRKNKV